MNDNITSHGQKGGITAKTVNINNQLSINENKKLKAKLFPYIVGIFTIIGVVTGVLTWLGLKPREAGMNEKQSGKKEVNVTSYNQQGGITAGEVNIGPRPRQVNTELEKQIDSLLPADKNVSITIDTPLGDSEAIRFGKQIEKYILSKGYTIKAFLQSVGEPRSGQVFYKNPKDGSITIQIGNKE